MAEVCWDRYFLIEGTTAPGLRLVPPVAVVQWPENNRESKIFLLSRKNIGRLSEISCGSSYSNSVAFPAFVSPLLMAVFVSLGNNKSMARFCAQFPAPGASRMSVG